MNVRTKRMAAAALAAALILGCASERQTTVVTNANMPPWINETPPEDMVYGIGFADNAQVSLRLTMAEQRARVSIAQQLMAKVRSMVSDYSREAGGVDNTSALQFQEAVSRQLAQADLTGAVPDQKWFAPDGKGYWVRIKMSRNQAAAAALTAFDSEAARYAAFKNAEAQAMMSAELDKAFAAPPAVSDNAGVSAAPASAPAASPEKPSTTAAAPGQAVPAGRTYNIGDKGPAGGIVFYDDFSGENGWRYLEAAPVEAERKLVWGPANVEVVGTKTDFKAGRENTARILSALKSRGEAALYCENLEYGGYDDWFLPSRDELVLMYRSLKQKGIGDFNNDWYWSSSQATDGETWAVRFNDGTQDYRYGNGDKARSYGVRAVRAF